MDPKTARKQILDTPGVEYLQKFLNSGVNPTFQTRWQTQKLESLRLWILEDKSADLAEYKNVSEIISDLVGACFDVKTHQGVSELIHKQISESILAHAKAIRALYDIMQDEKVNPSQELHRVKNLCDFVIWGKLHPFQEHNKYIAKFIMDPTNVGKMISKEIEEFGKEQILEGLYKTLMELTSGELEIENEGQLFDELTKVVDENNLQIIFDFLYKKPEAPEVPDIKA